MKIRSIELVSLMCLYSGALLALGLSVVLFFFSRSDAVSKVLLLNTGFGLTFVLLLHIKSLVGQHG